MAIFNTDYEMVYESNDVLDNMLEACNSMLDAIDTLNESTATQRHFNVTSKDYNKDTGDEETEFEKSAASNKDYSDAVGKDNVKNGANVIYNKNTDKNVSDSVDNNPNYSHLTKNQKDALKYGLKASTKGYMGNINTRYAKNGVPVKQIYDNARKDAEKKKTIKETCIYILDILDEI